MTQARDEARAIGANLPRFRGNMLNLKVIKKVDKLASFPRKYVKFKSYKKGGQIGQKVRILDFSVR
jgi:hypothetical protein